MKPIEEIRKDPRLMVSKNPVILCDIEGYITLSNGKKGTFICGRNEGGMEHVSIHLFGNKLPTWNEMCEVKSIFWDAEETVVQIHPKQSEYVNIGEVLHLWRPCNPKEWNRIEGGQQ